MRRWISLWLVRRALHIWPDLAFVLSAVRGPDFPDQGDELKRFYSGRVRYRLGISPQVGMLLNRSEIPSEAVKYHRFPHYQWHGERAFEVLR